MLKNVILLILICHAIYAQDNMTNSITIENGKTALIVLDNNTSTIHYKKRRINLYQHPTDTHKSFAFVPISYYEKPTQKPIRLLPSNKLLNVIEGNYTKEQIHVSNSKVTLSKKNKKRSAKEYSEAMNIYKTTTTTNYIHKPFILPLQSKITSDFGKARLYNHTLKGYHSGTDFRAKVGTPIRASNDGRVVLAKKRFYAGGSVIIDHGRGIYSCYYHLSAFKVNVGDVITQGQVIALSGKSGRVTGPHLHFSFYVQGVQVDPLDFIKKYNTLF